MQEFFHMGGYAFYVWSSFAIGLLSLVFIYFDAVRSVKSKQKIARQWINRQNQKTSTEKSEPIK